MKKIVTSILITSALVLSALILSACAGGTAYKTDVSVYDLSEKIDEAIGNSSTLAETNENYIKGRIKANPSDYDGIIVKVQSAGANIDEYGIVKVKSGDDVKAAEQLLKDYIQTRIDTWMPEYMPEELPKMKAATVKVFGQYVVYCVLEEGIKSDVFNTVENTLLDK